MVLNVAMGVLHYELIFGVCLSYSIPERRLIFWNQIIFSPDERFIWVGGAGYWSVAPDRNGWYESFHAMIQENSFCRTRACPCSRRLLGLWDPSSVLFNAKLVLFNGHVKRACRVADRWTHPVPKLRMGGVIPPLSPFILMARAG
jgi:hypothetical protein